MRNKLNAPMGWDNTTEMVASVVDAVNILSRMFQNANFKDPDKSDFQYVPRPYQDEVEKRAPETISLAQFMSDVRKGDAL